MTTLQLFHRLTFLLLYSVIVFNARCVQCQTVNNLVYQNITSFQYCVRYTNGTHSTGCTSTYWRNVGIIYLVESNEDMDQLVKTKFDAHYVPLMTPKIFTLENIHYLLSKRKIAGIIVIDSRNDTSSVVRNLPNGYSPEKSCPNVGFGMYINNSKYQNCKKIHWNSYGSGMLYENFDFPIFRVYTENDVQLLKKCYQQHNLPTKNGELTYPLCAVEMGDFMFAAQSTETCMRRNAVGWLTSGGFCDPLGDSNVWATLYPMVDSLKDRELVMATAQLDSNSQFYNFAPGADNDASGFITLLAAAHALGQAKNLGRITKPKKPIMFTFFQGESWDYIGSSRMVYDMQMGMFPAKHNSKVTQPANVKLNNIGHILELKQVGLQDSQSLWAHFDPLTGDKPTNEAFFKTLSNVATAVGINISAAANDLPLPPASLQRFYREDKGISGIVLTDHKENFTNLYYNSHFDSLDQLIAASSDGLWDSHTILTERLTKLATTVARTLYTLASGSTAAASQISANKTIIAELLHCFLQNASCSLFQQVVSASNAKSLPSTSYPRMIGVTQSSNQVTNLTNHLMVYFIGNQLTDVTEKSLCVSNSSKNSVYNFLWFQGSNFTNVCFQGTVYYSPAVSPAFLLNDYTSRKYSTWAESRWQSIDLKVFLVSNSSLQIGIFFGGLAVLLLSFLVVCVLSRRANILFTSAME